MAKYIENKRAKRLKTGLLLSLVGLFVLVGVFLYREIAVRKEDKEEITELRKSIDNNTAVVQKLLDKMGSD